MAKFWYIRLLTFERSIYALTEHFAFGLVQSSVRNAFTLFALNAAIQFRALGGVLSFELVKRARRATDT